MRAALLGTGRMGAGMARSMRRAGLDVTVWNRSAERAAPLREDGITVAGSIADAVSGADVVVTMLFDTDSVLEATAEIVGALGDEAVWLQSATVGPDGIAHIAEAAGDVALVDAPVLGTVGPAEKGALVPLVSGDAAVIERAGPVLEAIGSRTVVAGAQLGDASALKLACNAWVLSITAATAQSIAIARALGVDPANFLAAIEGGAADSPYAQLKGKAILSGELAPSFALDGGRKDLGLIRDAAAGAGVATDVLDGLVARYAAASEAGHGDEDLAAVIHGF